MKEHPINRLLDVSLGSVSRMVDVSKVVGQPIQVEEGKILIPISKVTFGFGAGGSEFAADSGLDKTYDVELGDEIFPFGGGSGGGVSINPIGFVTIDEGKIQMLSTQQEESTLNKILDIVNNFIKPGKP